MRRAAALSVLCAVSLIAAAQQKPSMPTAGETIEVSIVNVDVFVTDKAGNRVHGLTKDDFEIYENGVKQPITNFAEYGESGEVRVETPPGETAAAPLAQKQAPQKRVIGVFVDRFRLAKPLADPVFASMKRLLRDTVRPGDAVTVVTWWKGRLQVLQGYTDDLALIGKALDAIARQNTAAAPDVYAQERRERDDIEDYEVELEQMAESGGGGASQLRAADDAMKSAGARMEAKRDFADLDLKVRTINALMRSMSGLEGKRVLLLATHRLSQIAGAEHYWASGSAPMIDSLDRIELDTWRIMKSLYEAANANGVAIYPMFAEGVSASPAVSAEGLFAPGNVRSVAEGLDTSSASLSPVAHSYEYLIQDNETPVLKEVARQTGGLAAWGSGDVARLLNVIRDDFDSYYSLAYRATSRSADRARTIAVKTTKPKLVVRARREVIEKSDGRRMKDRVVSALFRPDDPGARLRFAVSIGKREAHGHKLRIPITVRIPISALYLASSGAGYGGAFGVYVAWGSVVGGVSDATQERRTFTIPAGDLGRAQRSFFTYQFAVNVNDATERVALGVADESSKEYGVRVIDLAQLRRAALAPGGAAGRQ